MLHHRLNVSVASAQDVIDEILSFVTDAAWATPWTEDPAYQAGANPGNLVLESPGATTMYIQVEVNAGFIHFGITSVNTQWNLGTPPLDTEINSTRNATGSGRCGLPAPVEDSILHMVADNDRIICLLENYPGDVWTILYVGLYQPLCAGADDPDPIIAVSNSTASEYSAIDMEANPGYEPLRFPNIVLKTDPRGFRRRFIQNANGEWSGGSVGTIPDKMCSIPKNDRAAADQAFVFAQWVTVSDPGRGEVASLSGSTGTNGIVRATDGLEPLDVVTVGADTYMVAPASYQPGAYDRACFLIGPLGSAI